MTAWQQSQDSKRIRDESADPDINRKTGGMMGKNDFLFLLSAQLRYQDPLNPQNDSDFAAQLAQFSSLEQMQNMNETLTAMSNYQSYSLIGKFAIANAIVDGKPAQIPGIIEGIFTKNGIAYALIGEYEVPVSSITDVFDSSHVLTTDSLMNASNNLIGRTVMAHTPSEKPGGAPGVVEGIVTRITVDKGTMYAQIDDGTDDPKIVPVNMIFDIRQPGTGIKPATPPDAKNFKADGKGGFLELSEDGKTELGLWTWDKVNWKWIFEDFFKTTEEENESETNNETLPGEETGEDPGEEAGGMAA